MVRLPDPTMFAANLIAHSVRGPFLITQALRPYIPSHDNARIIAISSIAARINTPGTSIYAGKHLFPCEYLTTAERLFSASKAALESFVRSWSNEFAAAQGITVNAVNPGPMRSAYSNLYISSKY